MTRHDCEGGGEAFEIAQLPKENDQHAASPYGFFGTPAYLSVSGQLHLEAVVTAGGAATRAYTLQQAFRAEASHTSRHLAEFCMCEVEVAFLNDLEVGNDPCMYPWGIKILPQSLMQVIETMLKDVIKHIQAQCQHDLEFLNS